MIFLVQNRKREYQHPIQDARMKLCYKYHPKQTIFIFWAKFAQKKVEKILFIVNMLRIPKIFSYHENLHSKNIILDENKLPFN